MNVLALPRNDLRGRDFSRFADDAKYTKIVAGRYLLSDYVLNYKGKNMKIEQLGTMEECIR